MTDSKELELALMRLETTIGLAEPGGVPMQWVLRDWLAVIKAHIAVIKAESK